MPRIGDGGVEVEVEQVAVAVSFVVLHPSVPLVFAVGGMRGITVSPGCLFREADGMCRSGRE